ncbi:MAG: HEAT repeat domain-containing protein [Chloroflexota bacterium]|nr:HEAT repeat domain-containing protein [Chloroflexota bacterium]
MSKKGQLPSFQQCLRMMRKHDPQVQEDGYHYLLAQAPVYLDQLIAQFEVEEDIGVRRWLLELIGETRSLAALPLLTECLRSDDEYLRRWAMWGLKTINTKEARRTLWEARSYTFATEEETQEFRHALEAVAGLDRGGANRGSASGRCLTG